MAESISERLRRYLRETKQRWETLAAKLDLPPQVLQRILFVDTEEAPPQYVLDRLTKITGISWGGTAASNESFERALPAGTDFSSAFFRSSSREPERADNPFKDSLSMPAENNKTERMSIHDLFHDAPVKQSAPELSEEERWANFNEHIRLSIPLFGSAAEFGRQVGTSGVTVRNWLKGRTAKEDYLPRIAKVLGCTVDELFEAPSEDFKARMAQTPAEVKTSSPDVPDADAAPEDRIPNTKRAIDELFSPMPAGAHADEEPVSEPIQPEAEETASAEEEPVPGDAAPSVSPDVPAAAPEEPDEEDSEEEPVPAPEESVPQRSDTKPANEAKRKFGPGAEIADLIPDGSGSQSIFSDRLTAYMNEHELSLGDMTKYMPRKERDIFRLQTLVLGRSSPKPKELASFSALLGISEEQLLIESLLPGERIRGMASFEAVCREHGITVGGAPAALPQLEPAPVPSAPEPKAEPAAEKKAPDPSACVQEVRPTSALQRAELEIASERPRGIAAVEFGSGRLDFATDGRKAKLFTVTGSECDAFTPETTLVVCTEGFGSDTAVFAAQLPQAGWYLMRTPSGEVPQFVDPVKDRETLLPFPVVGIVVAAIKTKLL